MNKNKWFKFYASDFLAGIHNLEQIEVTAYIIVLCELYDREGSCRRDDAEMARRCRMRKPHFTKALDGLIAKHKIDCFQGILSNKRVTKEIEDRTRIALDKAARREHERSTRTTQAEHEQRGKRNENNRNAGPVHQHIEERNKNNKPSTSVLYAREGSGEKLTISPALLATQLVRKH